MQKGAPPRRRGLHIIRSGFHRKPLLTHSVAPPLRKRPRLLLLLVCKASEKAFAHKRRPRCTTTLLRFLYLQAPYRSLPRKRASSLISLLLLSAKDRVCFACLFARLLKKPLRTSDGSAALPLFCGFFIITDCISFAAAFIESHFSLIPSHTELFTLPPFPFSFVINRGMNGVQRLRRSVYLIAELSHSAPIAARRAVQLAGFASLADRNSGLLSFPAREW